MKEAFLAAHLQRFEGSYDLLAQKMAGERVAKGVGPGVSSATGTGLEQLNRLLS
jgi:hypothetical protein